MKPILKLQQLKNIKYKNLTQKENSLEPHRTKGRGFVFSTDKFLSM